MNTKCLFDNENTQRYIFEDLRVWVDETSCRHYLWNTKEQQYKLLSSLLFVSYHSKVRRRIHNHIQNSYSYTNDRGERFLTISFLLHKLLSVFERDKLWNIKSHNNANESREKEAQNDKEMQWIETTLFSIISLSPALQMNISDIQLFAPNSKSIALTATGQKKMLIYFECIFYALFKMCVRVFVRHSISSLDIQTNVKMETEAHRMCPSI